MKETLKLLCLIMVVLALSFSLTGCPPDPEDMPNENEENIDDDQEEQEPDPTLEEIIAEQLREQEGTIEKPAALKLEVDLGIMFDNADNWHRILKIIEAENKYVDLDLSDCIVSHSFFDPDYTITEGKDKIIKITLPDTSVDIIGVDNLNSDKRAFIHFTNLEFAGGKNIKHIGSRAFYLCGKLKEADFPKLEDFDDLVFASCVNLVKADFPALVSIGNYAFSGCTNLKTVNFPELINIKPYTFSDCTNLETANIPKNKHIDQRAFDNCKNLTEVYFPLTAGDLGNFAFNDCIKLEKAYLPKVEVIHSRAFFNCVNLKETDFSSAVHIADHAFYNCTSLEEVVFPKAMIIEPMSFGNCISLTTARFLADPDPALDDDLKLVHPLSPWLNKEPGLPCVKETILFYNNAFNGCASLETLDIRYSWNVYFVGNALANIGKKLTLYLFDDDGTKSFGHPPIDIILGSNETITLESIKFMLPSVPNNLSKVNSANGGATGYHGIAVYIAGFVTVTIERY